MSTAVHFGSDSTVYVSDNHCGIMGSPRVQAFDLHTMRAISVFDNSSFYVAPSKNGKKSPLMYLHHANGDHFIQDNFTVEDHYIEVTARVKVPTKERKAQGMSVNYFAQDRIDDYSSGDDDGDIYDDNAEYLSSGKSLIHPHQIFSSKRVDVLSGTYGPNSSDPKLHYTQKMHDMCFVRTRGLAVRWTKQDFSQESNNKPISGDPEYSDDTTSNNDAGLREDSYFYNFHFIREFKVHAEATRPSILDVYTKQQVVHKSDITPIDVQVRYKYYTLEEQHPGNGKGKQTTSWKPNLTGWIWGKLYALDHKSGQYVVEVLDVEKIIKKYKYCQSTYDLDEYPMLHSILANAIPHCYQCDYPLVTHSFIRTKPPVPQPLLSHPSGIATTVHTSTNNRSTRKQTKEILFVCDKEQHMIHCLQMTFADHSVRSKGRQQGNKASDQTKNKYLYSIGGRGSRPGQLSSPHAIAIHKHKLFVADTGNNRIQCFVYVKDQSKGKHSWGKWHVECTYPDSFKAEYGQWQNSVSNYDRKSGKRKTIKSLKNSRTHRGEKLAHNFFYDTLTERFGQLHASHKYNSLLARPEGICIDSLGLCIVADTGHHAIRIFGIEEEQIDVDNVRAEELLSVTQFGSIPLDMRWKYKPHPSKDKHGRPQFYRYIPNHRFTLLATWGGKPSSVPGFFRFPRSISNFDWVLNENIDKNFDAKQAKKFVHYLAVLDSGNDRVQFIEYHRGEQHDKHTIRDRMNYKLPDGEKLHVGVEFKELQSSGSCCIIL